MARSGARVRVFSDDGHCVADARLMRRALEYVRAFDGVRGSARPGPAARRPGRLLPRGRDLRPARADRLARRGRGQHRGPRRAAGRADPVPRTRLPRLHRGDGRGAPLGQATWHQRDRRGHPAPPAADHRRGRRLRPDVQGEPAAATRRARAGPARRAVRRHHRRRRHRPRPARPARQGARLRRGRVRHARPGDRAGRGDRDHDQPRPVRLAGTGRADVDRAGPHRPAARPGPAVGRRRAGEP